MVGTNFILAGNSIFTVETPDQGHRTYRVSVVEASDRWPEAYFVSLLTGPDNTSDYQYIGKLDPFTGQVSTTAKSKLAQDSYPVRLLNRVLARVWSGDYQAFEDHGYRLHHEGRCGRCGRKLTTPSSVTTGIGPECAKIMGLDYPTEPVNRLDYGPPSNYGLDRKWTGD